MAIFINTSRKGGSSCTICKDSILDAMYAFHFLEIPGNMCANSKSKLVFCFILLIIVEKSLVRVHRKIFKEDFLLANLNILEIFFLLRM